VIRGFKYRFYPTPEQEQHLARVFGHVRFVYNGILFKRKIERMTYTQASATLSKLKIEFPFLNEVSCVPLQQSLRHQQRAFVNLAEKRAKFPKFKKKTDRQSAEYTKSAFQYEDGVLRVAKLGRLAIVWSRRFQGEPSTIHLSKNSAGRYHVSFRVNAPLQEMSAATGEIGLDLGLTSFVVTTQDERVDAPKPLVAALQQLRRAQQTVSRRKQGSKNREKARIRVAKIHQRVADIRTDWLHKLSTRLVQENQLIATEDLTVKNMVRNRSLARAISDASWSQFVRMLEYKSAWYGRKLVKISRWFPSSKLCRRCGQVVESLPLNVRQWTCDCGATHDRDLNAARNILAEGRSVSACGETVRPDRNIRQASMKQEPPESRA
jgi:putative transposase